MRRVAVALLVLLAPLAQPTHDPAAPAAWHVVLLDLAGDGPTPNDPLVLHFGGGASLAAGDVRLTATPCCAAGTRVAEGDADAGRAFEHLDTTLAFAERDGRFGPGLGDAVYLDAGGPGAVSEGDLRLASMNLPAGARVAAGDTDRGRNLTVLDDGRLRVKYLDLDGDGYFDGPDLLYADLTGLALASPGDVLLTATGQQAFGTRLGAAASPAATRDAFLLEPRFAHTDFGLDGLTPDDAVYLVFEDSASVAAGSVRLTARGDHEAGTRVAGQDAEVRLGYPALPLPGAIARARNPAARYDFESDLYLDLDASGAVSAGDFRLSMGPFAGHVTGSVVQAGDADAGRTVDALFAEAPLKYVDADANRFHDAGDALYLDVSGRRAPTLGDVRLAVPGALFGSRVREGDPDFVPVARRDFAGSPRLMFWDVQFANGRLDPLEPAFAHLARGNESAPGDVRLADTGERAAGTRVADGDGDASAPLTALANATLAYLNGDGHPGLNPGRADTLYLDADGDGRANANDVRLTTGGNESAPLAAGARVSAAGERRALTLLVPGGLPLKYGDRNGNGRFDQDALFSDMLYLDLTGAHSPAAGDVRLTPAELRGLAFGFGSKVVWGDPDAAPVARSDLRLEPPVGVPAAEEPEPVDEVAQLHDELERAQQGLRASREEIARLQQRLAELQAQREREEGQLNPGGVALLVLGAVALLAAVGYFVRRKRAFEKR